MAQPSADFADIARLIAAARQQAVQAVNTLLIDLYWQVGERISRRIAAAEWGDGVVDQLARYLTQTQPGLRGFTRANLFRMRQFYEAYAGNELVAPLVRQLSWSHFDNLKIKVAEYLLVLPEKKVLLEKLHRSIEIAKNKITNNAESIDDQTVICNLVQPFSAAFFCEFRRNERCYSVGIYSDEATKWRNRKASGKAR